MALTPILLPIKDGGGTNHEMQFFEDEDGKLISGSVLCHPDTKLPIDPNALAGVVPQLTEGGNLSVQTATTGTNYTAFSSQPCKQLTLINNTATDLEVRQDGSGVAVPVFARASYTFFGLTNANQLGVRRVDTSNTQVTAQARWES